MILLQFLKNYPNSDLTESINESVQYLEETEETSSHDLQEGKLKISHLSHTQHSPKICVVQWDTNDQEKEEFYLGTIEQDQILSDMHYYSSPITSEFPVTPELSPRSMSRKKSLSSSTSSFIKQRYLKHDFDEFDKEVANTTKYHHHSKKRSNIAIQTLQLEVQALCEEIDQLRLNNPRTSSILKWRSLWFFKSVAKHAFFNFLILMMLFIVLWRRKSPIAYAVIGYAGPRFKDFLRYLFNNVVFWKITV